jgi:hypothetical protein
MRSEFLIEWNRKKVLARWIKRTLGRGFLLCDGRTLSRKDYPKLYDVLKPKGRFYNVRHNPNKR